MSAYGALARYYDLFTRPADCERMGRKHLRLLRQSGAESGLLLDLCCGTGSLSLFFAGQGFDVTGVDASQDMLSAAKDKAEAAGVELLLVHQRLERLDLCGTYDAAVCALDGINHLPSLAVDAPSPAPRCFCARRALCVRPAHRAQVYRGLWSVGLHPRDGGRLLRVAERLRPARAPQQGELRPVKGAATACTLGTTIR